MANDNQTDLVHLTAEVVASFVSNNNVAAADLGGLIGTVHRALLAAATGPSEPVEQPPPKPAVPIKKSVTPDYIICLDDGQMFKSMRRHLSTLGMTPDEYRAKWKLPRDYPMVAPNYAKARSDLALKAGFGKRPVATLEPTQTKRASKKAATAA